MERLDSVKDRDSLHTRALAMSGMATMQIINRRGRTIYTIAAEHYSDQAKSHIQEEVVPSIENNSKWLFLIEGYHPRSRVPEVVLATEIATSREIPIYDPILNPYDIEVAKRLTLSSREIFYDEIIGVHAALIIDTSPSLNEILVAIILDEDPPHIQRCLRLIRTRYEKNPQGTQRWKDHLHEQLLHVSNAMSIQLVDYYLDQHSSRSEVALYLGLNHQKMLDLTTDQIHPSWRLSTTQAEEIIQQAAQRRERVTSRLKAYFNK